jgi:hypothetical protein
MTRQVALALALLAVTVACGRSPVGPSPTLESPSPDTLSRFTGRATVSGPGCATATTVTVRDLPTPGFANRFSFTFTDASVLTCLGTPPAGAVPVTITARADGSMLAEVRGWLTLTVTPDSASVRDQLRAAAPGSETRDQRATLLPGAVLLIEEPVA